MPNSTEDNPVMSHIKKLTAREDALYGEEGLTEVDIQELQQIKMELDQYWDLLHQQRALRDSGKNPEKAALRTEDTIKNYQR